MKVFRALGTKEFKERLKKAVEFYEKTNYRKPDKISVGQLFLPRVITPSGEVIDLEELYKDCKVLVSDIGYVPFILYVYKKGNDKARPYIHFTESQVFLVADPDDPKRLFLVHTGKLRMTERGLVDGSD
jgi:hypothetical protein